ncbi:MAG TPA: alpha-glucosidase [Anaerolineae bacterium]|nr:alpha-glucosidase [Anaerolineae bacterium]
MDLGEALRSIQFIGLGNVFRTLTYTFRRGRIDSRHLPPESPAPLLPPGDLQHVEPTPNGGRFHFVHAELEVHFLAPDLVRLTWSPGALPLPYSLSDMSWPATGLSLKRMKNVWRASSNELTVQIDTDGGLRYEDEKGHILRQELPPEQQGSRWRHRAQLQSEERIYGLGTRAAPLNLRPGVYRMWNQDPGGKYHPGTDPLYLCIPVYLGLHDGGSYLVFFENSFDAAFRFDDLADAEFEGGCLRTYFVPGPPDRALQRYADLTGHAPLPPRWSLGYHQSRWSYMNSREVRDLVASFQRHDLPLDAVHLDIHYMRGYRVFSVDPERFPDLPALAQELTAAGVNLVAIIDPGVKADHHYAQFDEARRRGFLCKLPDGNDLLAPVWPGMCGFPDFSHPDARAWWSEQYPALLDQGLAGIWHDMNEPAAFVAWGEPTLPLATRHHMEGRGGDHREMHNLYGLLMNRAGFEGMRAARPERRPFILSRSGWAGVQRHTWTWTADIATTWASLRQTVPSILGLGLSGVPFAGPDIGGFSGDPSAELFTRWFQLATFLPFFRTHSALTTPRREPWCFGEPTLSIVREYLLLRKRLIPYLYTLAWETSLTGKPLVRPLFWASLENDELWDTEDCFLLGEALLVAPILEEGAESRSLKLPAGVWYDFWTDELLQGPNEILLQAGLERIPLLVRAGSLLPTQEEGELVLHLYPAEREKSLTHLYSDAGDGYDESRIDLFYLEPSTRKLNLLWESSGDFAFPYAGISVHIHAWKPRRCLVDGQAKKIEGERLHFTLPFKNLILER